MMAQHCWLSSFLIFQGILISIAKKPYISYDFSGGGGYGAPAPLSCARMLLPRHHRPMRLAGVRLWSDFVCLFGLELLGAQKNRLTAVNNFPC